VSLFENTSAPGKGPSADDDSRVGSLNPIELISFAPEILDRIRQTQIYGIKVIHAENTLIHES